MAPLYAQPKAAGRRNMPSVIIGSWPFLDGENKTLNYGGHVVAYCVLG